MYINSFKSYFLVNFQNITPTFVACDPVKPLSFGLKNQSNSTLMLLIHTHMYVCMFVYMYKCQIHTKSIIESGV